MSSDAIIGVVVGGVIGIGGTSLTTYVEHLRSLRATQDAERSRYRERGAEALAAIRELLDDMFWERMIDASLPQLAGDEPQPTPNELWARWRASSAVLVALSVSHPDRDVAAATTDLRYSLLDALITAFEYRRH